MTTKTPLPIGCGRYDRLRAIEDGRVALDRYDLQINVMPLGQIPPAAFDRRELALAEVSTGGFLARLDRGDAGYVGIPAFVSLGFRHDCIYVRSDSRITKPQDLAGALIGVPEYFGTTGIWLRGMLQDDAGIDPKSVSWWVGPIEGAGGPIKPNHPPGVTCAYAKPGESMTDLLLRGELDAIFAHRLPQPFRDGRFRRLYSDLEATERAYYEASGCVPLLHMFVLRDDCRNADPALPGQVLDAFTRAKDIALQDLNETAVYATSLPSLTQAVERSRSLLGEDFWPYGMARNSKALATFARYCHEQGLTRRQFELDEMFPDF